MRQRGFTLVEVLGACTLAGVLASVALPAWQGTLLKARRTDAIAALGRLQAAQERHRAHHGLYGSEFAALGVAVRSDQGLYELTIEAAGPESYRASAAARAGGAQAADTDCPRLVIEVASGFVQQGPTPRCWNR